MKDNMIGDTKTLKQRYRNYKFKVKEPILDRGSGYGYFFESQGIKNATIMDLNVPEHSKFKYIKADI